MALFATERNLDKMLRRLAQEDTYRKAEFINIYYGEDVKSRGGKNAEALFRTLPRS